MDKITRELYNIKIRQIEKATGESIEDLIEKAVFDCKCMGICMNEGCDYHTDLEPDNDQGWCEVCETNSLKSILILGGII